MKKSDRLILFDGDYLLFRTLSAVETEVHWAGDVWTLHINEREARQAIDNSITRLAKEAGGGKPLLCFGAASFRKQLAPDYKASRKGTRLPMLFKKLHREFRTGNAGYPSAFKWGVEGDDVMGILATKPGNEGSIIISEDKDMLQIPGLVFRHGETMEITAEAADKQHLYQTLIGDVADGYKGCPGVGPKTAEKYLAEGWKGVLKAFTKAGLTTEDALLQARLARILRWTEWDTEAQQPRLWSPSS